MCSGSVLLVFVSLLTDFKLYFPLVLGRGYVGRVLIINVICVRVYFVD